jgi:predicted dehydrogenase
MKPNPLRWGILGTANIARKNWHAIHLAGNSVLTAVASRDLARSERFLAECQADVPLPVLPRAFGSYEALLASPDVDAVYLPLPTGIRREWVIRAAEAGKHVVCEKPCAPTAADLRAMLDACRLHGVQFMDGVMFVHGQRLQRIKEVLADGSSIGEIRRLASQFSFRGDADFFAHNMRTHSLLEPQGCLGDLGWYSLVFTLEALGGQMPREVVGRIHSHFGNPESSHQVPAEFSGELRFDNGVSSVFYCSFLTENQQWANVSGSKGHLQVADFVLPFCGCEAAFEVNQPEFQVNGCHFVMEAHARRIVTREYSNNHPTAQETNLFRHFADQVASGTLNEAWPERAWKTQRLVDACLESARNVSRPVTLT